MKIVFTVHTYWPNKDGVQYVTQYLAEGLVQLGHEVTVITTWEKKQNTVQMHNGVKVVYLYLKANKSIFVSGREEYTEYVLQCIRSCDCLINCCVQSPNNNVLLKYLPSIKCKKILYMHGMHDFYIRREEFSNIKYVLWHFVMNVRWHLFYYGKKRFFQEYDTIIDIHEDSKAISFMKRLGCKANFQIIHNAVQDFNNIIITEKDLDKYPVLRDKFFLCVANYNERKNQKMLIEAFLKVKRRDDYKLVLIGRGHEYAAELNQIVVENNASEYIYVFEDMSREVTTKFIKMQKCGILSSRYEVYPIFISESIACAHPFISSNVGCVNEIPGGIVVNSIDEMSFAIQEIIQNSALTLELGEKGYKFAIENLLQCDKIHKLEQIITKTN